MPMQLGSRGMYWSGSFGEKYMVWRIFVNILVCDMIFDVSVYVEI